MNLAIIPARGGSKRVPNKNFTNFAGKPMIMHPLGCIRETEIFDKIHVSTDSDEIRQICEENGFPVDFMRDSSLADDYTGLLPVLKWVLEQFDLRGEKFENICCIYPASPLILSSDFVKAYKLFSQHSFQKPLMTVSSFPVPVEWAFCKDSTGLIRAKYPEKLKIRSQDLDDSYYECASFLFFNRKHILDGNPFENDLIGFEIPRERSVDIDTFEDLAFAERLYHILNDN